eukprot:g5220.t1
MSVTRTSTSKSGLLRVELQIAEAEADEAANGPNKLPRAAGVNSNGSAESVGSLESSSSIDDSDDDKPAHPHHLKLLALSEVLMRSPSPVPGKSKSKELTSAASAGDIGLLEEARNRWRGRKERYVHWDKVEINGKEFPLQRADTSSAAQRSATPNGTGALVGGGRSTNSASDSAPEKPETSYLLVGHSTCDMCLMTFEASSVSGVITMKRIIEARRDWGLASSKSKIYEAASSLYGPARLCALCSQFFCSKDADGRGGGDGGELVPLGVGRSDEHVSLSLESMASNKPLPDKITRAATAAGALTSGVSSGGKPRAESSGGGRLSRRRRRDAGGSSDGGSCSGSRRGARHAGDRGASAAVPNFQLDELIADDRFIVKETDLARQHGAVASQSSTADGMGADVCMGYPAANRLAASRSSRPSSQRCTGAAGGEATRGYRPASVDSIPEGSTDFESSVGSAATLGGPGPLDAISLSSDEKAAAAKRASTTASLVVQALSPARSATRTAAAASPPPRMDADEMAAAAAAAARTCSRTRRENQPWWEVDLGGAYPVRCIRVWHPDRRTEATKAGASPFVDVSPFWIMTSAGAIGEAAPEDARKLALASKRVASHGKVTVWNLGVNHFATAVRVQAEGVKSLQLARVEVIKGGGTQQAKDAVQQQLGARNDASSYPLNHQHPSPVDEASASMAPQGSTSTALTTRSARNNNGSGHNTAYKAAISSSDDHKEVKTSLLRFYQQDREGGGDGAAAAAAAAAKTAFAAASQSSSNLHAQGAAATVLASGGTELLGTNNQNLNRAQTCPSAYAGAGSSSLAGGRCSTTGRKRRQRRSGKDGELPGEDVRRLLLRAMVGYDWVDEFNSKDVRVRGAFTEEDVVVLEEIFSRCAFGDDAEARAAATVTDQSIRLDPGELCGDLRRLQLQVQTNPGGKGKTPMLLAVRESANLFQLFSSSVVEALPDALARAEAQLPPAQRPLGLDWTRFLGVMGLCLEGVYTGTGLLAPSAVARLFEEKLDDKLEFLTRRRSRLPPPRKVVKEPTKKYRGFSGPLAAAAGAGAGADGDTGMSETTQGRSRGVAGAGSGSIAAGSSAIEDTSLREAGSSSLDMGDDTLLESSLGGGSRRRDGTPATAYSANDQDGGISRLGGEDGGLRGRRGGGGRGGGTAALKSLLRPQARHEVSKDYGEAVSKRRERQREALRRAPEPDVEPTRAYKPCGLCQAPFPVESLGSTVSLKVLGTFLAKAGAPSERFDRKASRLCALHRLPLCVFCSQFFDPDFPGGIVPPGGYTERSEGGGGRGGRRKRRHGGGRSAGGVSLLSSSASSLESCSRRTSSSRAAPGPVDANCLVPFFDDRFPDRFSDTPAPSSAPPARVHSSPISPLSKTGKQEGHGSAFSCGTKRDAFVGGTGGGEGCKRGMQHVREAMELREVGGLVRRGCSIRDRLAAVL